MTVLRIASAVTLLALAIQGCSPGVESATSAGAAGAKALFSAVIDGKTFKGDHVAGLSTNVATITPPGSEIIELRFALAPTSPNDEVPPPLSFALNFPVKTGTYAVMGTDNAACGNCDITYSQEIAPFAKYWPQNMQVTITSLTAERVAGTFSGTLVLDQGMAIRKVAPLNVRVENGQFDIPIAHY
jgi:hypothetical protein